MYFQYKITSLEKQSMLRILILMLFKYCLSEELQPCTNAQENQVCKVTEHYDRSKIQGNLPITLIPTFDIFEVTELDVVSGSLSITLSLRIEWEDQNIAYNPKKMP